MKNYLNIEKMKCICLCMALMLTMDTALVLQTSAREYQDKDEILDTGFELDTDHELKVTRPSNDISTTEKYYYITGSSDPNSPLTCNGEEVESRGIYGTFGLYEELAEGENKFTFRNGEKTQTIVITKTTASSGGEIATISNLRRTGPAFDDVAKSGEKYKIRCTAPANGEVSVTVGEESYKLEQEAIATTGVEAYYSAEITLPEVESDKVENLGHITYKLFFNGKSSSVESDGNLYVMGSEAHLLARVNQNAAILYEEGEKTANQVSLISRGAVDTIVDSNDDYFQLGMGSWISKSYADIVTDDIEWKNIVSDSTYRKTDGGEELIIKGTAAPAFKTYATSEKITIRLYNTKWNKSGKFKSDLFSSMRVIRKNNYTTLEFYKKEGITTVGYDISFDGEGNTHIFFNPKADNGSENKPLKNMTVLVDPGHGGYDGGALGVLYANGPVEKDITMAHSLVLKNRLESLGADVVLAVSPNQSSDSKVELTDRVETARENRVDFYISMHANSIAENSNGLKPTGVEVYYFDNNSKLLADAVHKNVAEYNNRTARGVANDYYYVTRNPLCPSMLLEMGFVSNPIEYDELCSPDSMYQTANAIADALIEYLDK